MACLNAPVQSCPALATVPRATSRPGLRLVGLASITVSFLAASSAPTPLYPRYATAWGFSALTTTIVFGVYALAVLGALLSAGRLSDHLGRRPVLLAGIVGQITSMVIFVGAHSVTALVCARIVQGLATGSAIGAVGAAMLDLDPLRGAVANATAPGLGSASGSLLSAVLVTWLPAPGELVYLVLLGVLVAQGLWVLSLPETSPMAAGTWSSIMPRLSLPETTRRPLAVAVPVLFASWALAGFYGSLGPSLVARLSGSSSVLEGGLALTVLAGVGAAATYVLRQVAATRVLMVGAVSLVAGIGLSLVGVDIGSVSAFFAGTTVAGVGFGAGFQGAVRLVAPLAAPGERAGVLSVLYIVAYIGMGLPAVLAGLAVVDLGGLITVTYGYGLALIALAAVAAVNLTRLHPSKLSLAPGGPSKP